MKKLYFFVGVLLSMFLVTPAMADSCKVIVPNPSVQEVWSPYSGECKSGLADGVGQVGIATTNNGKKYNNMISGTFKEGKLNGKFTSQMDGGGSAQGTYKMNVPDGAYKLEIPSQKFTAEYKDGKVVKGMLWEKAVNGLEVGVKTENNVHNARCQSNFLGENNCSLELRKAFGLPIPRCSNDPLVGHWQTDDGSRTGFKADISFEQNQYDIAVGGEAVCFRIVITKVPLAMEKIKFPS